MATKKLTNEFMEKILNDSAWQELSSTDCETILTEDCLEQFEDYWDWAKLINRWHGDKLYNADFLERYADKIPSNQLQDSRLWRALVEERVKGLKLEIMA